jgi:molecular chaperone Hsp33
MDRLLRGVSQNSRFFIADTTELVKKANELHACNVGSLAAFGRFLTGGCLIGATLKGKDLLTLRTTTNGSIGSMLVTVNAEGHIKGYMANPNADGEKIADFVGAGTLKIIKDMGLKEPYVGISEMKNGDIAAGLVEYFYMSEQTPSVLSLGVSFDEEANIKFAGGFMIQILPHAEESFIVNLENKMSLMKSFTEFRAEGLELEKILQLLYGDEEATNPEKLIEGYEILEEKKLNFVCDCSRERFYTGIQILGEEEIHKIIEEDGGLEVVCQFCSEKYSFSKEDFK